MNSIETEEKIRGLALMLGATSLNFGHGNCVVAHGSRDEKPVVVLETYHIEKDGRMWVEGPKRDYIPDYQI